MTNPDPLPGDEDLEEVMSEFTPGPWSCELAHILCQKPYEAIYTIAPEGKEDDYRIAVVRDEAGPNVFEGNAHLIAAAPELYEALEFIFRHMSYQTPAGYMNCRFCDAILDEGFAHDDTCPTKMISNALSKARGEQ